MPIIELLPRNGGTAALDRILDLLGRAAAVGTAGARRIDREPRRAGPRADRARRIALVGLRGAGKSTLGGCSRSNSAARSSSSTAWSSRTTARAFPT